jgi:hypothetical protein
LSSDPIHRADKALFPDKRTIRIFISSPSDVRPERLQAERIVARLSREFGYHFHLEAVLWEREPLVATHHFQDPQNIPQPRSTDIVVVILWSRLGTVLPVEKFRGALSGRPVTGTEWEFEDALAGARENGVPHLLLYCKTASPTAALDDRKALNEQLVQLDMVQEFTERWIRSADGRHLSGAFRTFTSTADFEAQLYENLNALLGRLVGAQTSETVIRWHQPPFRGLLSFEYEHAPIFFGRTRARNEIRELLARQEARGRAFVLVLGASGSGKSSLVKAGLLPDLMLPGMIGRVALVRWEVMRPSDSRGNPLDALAAAILSATALPELADLQYTSKQLAELLLEVPNQASFPIRQGLAIAGKKADLAEAAESRLVIVVDQLEEIFTLERFDWAARETFIIALDALARNRTARV